MVVVDVGTLGDVAVVLELGGNTLGRVASLTGADLVTLEKMSLSWVNAWRVWVSGGGSRGLL